MTNQQTSISYTLNSKEIIISIDGAWDEFAEQNNGQHIQAVQVCGKSIWDYIKSDTTRMWLSTLMQLARVKKTIVERPYRCDSPEIKRFMLMRLIPLSNGNMVVEHQQISTEKRKKPIYFDYHREHSTMSFRCSICGRVEIDKQWVEADSVKSNTDGKFRVAYTVCDHCRSDINRI